jgi:hypothetical protein
VGRHVGEGGAGGGWRRPGAAYCAGDRGARRLEQSSRGSGRKKREERDRGLICKTKEIQGLHCKELITFKPVLKWRWSQKQKCIVFQAPQFCFKVHL